MLVNVIFLQEFAKKQEEERLRQEQAEVAALRKRIVHKATGIQKYKYA